MLTIIEGNLSLDQVIAIVGLVVNVLQSHRSRRGVVQRYRAFFALLDWQHVFPASPGPAKAGKPAHPPTAYVKALLVKVCEHHDYITQLRCSLLEHPLLVLESGFHPVLDQSKPYGFDGQRTLPCDRWLRHQQQHFNHCLLQDLFPSTVHALQDEIPGVKEDLWGYGSGVVAALTADSGDVILAENTLTFDQGDVTHFFPLYRQTAATLGFFPTHITADAAFDAWYAYQKALLHGGIAAIPINQHAHPTFTRDPDGIPLCPIGKRMHPTYDAQPYQRLSCSALSLSTAASRAHRGNL